MRRARLMAAVAIVCIALASKAVADCGDELEDLVGYTIVATKTIQGWRGDDPFTDGTALRCAEYGYQYAYRPMAALFGTRFEYQGRAVVLFKMLVEDEVYDMTGVR